MTRPKMSKPEAATRRFEAIHMVMAMAFIVAMFAAATALVRLDDPAARWGVSAIPVAVLAAWAGVTVKLVLVSDEMLQQLKLRAAAISGAIVILFLTSWGILEQLVPAPHFPLFLAGPAFGIVHGFVLFTLNPKP